MQLVLEYHMGLEVNIFEMLQLPVDLGSSGNSFTISDGAPRMKCGGLDLLLKSAWK
jgi:hypothetical protein